MNNPLLISIIFMSLLLVSNVQSATLTVCGSGCNSTTIQGAIDSAGSGDTVEVSAGTYDEQILINKSLTIQGTGSDTIIRPSSAAILIQIFSGLFWYGGTKQVAGIIAANVPDGSNVTIKNLKVDESGVATKPSGSDYLAGIFYRETGGITDNVNIAGGGAWSGTDRGYGIFLSATTNTVYIEVKNSAIANFDKNGIEAMGNQLTIHLHNNIIIGRGSVSDEVQNGIDVGRDAIGIVNYNTISNLSYTPASSLSAGILFYHYVTPAGKSAVTTGNIITNCQIGIIFKNANATARDNKIYGGAVGLDGIFTQPNYAGAYTASFVNNTISGIANRSAMDAETYSTLTPPNGAILSVTMANNTLTTGYGAADGIFIGGGAGGVTAIISGNNITGFGEYGINLGDARAAGATIASNSITNNMRGISIAAANAANINASSNDISGNNNYDIYNGGLGTLDATLNWWGSPIPNSSKFYGSVTYYPFCISAGCAINIEDAASEFTGGNTTNFSAVSNWSAVDLYLESDNGDINWTLPIDLTGSNMMFNDNVEITPRSISVDSSAMPELDFPAILTFKNAGFSSTAQFDIYRNGAKCPKTICTNVYMLNGNVVIETTKLSHFILSPKDPFLSMTSNLIAIILAGGGIFTFLGLVLVPKKLLDVRDLAYAMVFIIIVISLIATI